MNGLLAFSWPIPETVVERLGWVLVHSMWQFALVAFLAWLAIRTMRRRSAVTRYGILVQAMALLAAAPVATWLLQPDDDIPEHSAKRGAPGIAQEVDALAAPTPKRAALNVASGTTSPALQSTAPSLPSWTQQATGLLRPMLAWIVLGWGLGVVLCSTRPLLGWHTLRRLRRVGISPVPAEVLTALRHASTKLGLHRVVGIVQSTLVQVPVVIGCVKPVILLPVSLLTSMSCEHLEAILAHELAHVRRHDFVVNLLQTMAETLFFYHPAVWWLSRQIRVEREHCCDDLVVTLLGNRVDYGRALVAIEQMRDRNAVLALGATDGSLLARVRRIAGIDPQRTAIRWSERWPWALLGLACLGLALSMNRNLAAKDDDGEQTPQPLLAKLPGGIAVELIAVGFHPSKDRDWWQPGGDRLQVRPRVEGRFSVLANSPEQAQCREFLIRIRGLPREHSIQTDFGVSFASHSSYADGLWVGEHGAGPFQSKTATIRVGLTTEPFGPLVTIDVTGRKATAAKISKELKPFYDRVVPLGVAEAEGGTELVLESAPLHELYKVAALELRAVDIDGKVQRSSSMVSPATGIRIGFNLPRERIARFEYQLRPYRHWVTFKNVSLEPGQTTAVGIVTESTSASKTLPDSATPAAVSAPPKGLEFLAAYPKLHGLSLDMTEKQFLEIAASQKLQPRKAGSQYRISTGDGHTVIVMFRENEGKCTGIQRIRGEDPARPAPGDIKSHLPEWLKVHYNRGLVATLDDDHNVVSLSTGEVMSDELLAKLKTLPKLRELDIGGAKSITPAGLQHLAELSSLQKLSLSSLKHNGQGLGDEVLERLAGSKSLRELRVDSCGTTDAGVRALEAMPQLTHLELYLEPRLTDAALDSIAKLKQLKCLSLNSYVGTEHGWMRFSKEATRALVALQDLEHLHLVGQGISPETLQFPRLQSLSLGGETVDDAMAARIEQCRRLQLLQLVYTNISDDGLKKVADLPELRQLNLDSRVVTDAGILHLKRLPKLEHISLRATRLSDEALRHLAEIKTLTRVDLHGSGEPGYSPGSLYTIAGVQQLKRGPNLRTLWLTLLRSDSFLGLKELTQLRGLTLAMTNVRDDELDALEEALPNTSIGSDRKTLPRSIRTKDR